MHTLVLVFPGEFVHFVQINLKFGLRYSIDSDWAKNLDPSPVAKDGTNKEVT